MKRMVRRIVLPLVTLAFVGVLNLATPVRAQENWVDTDYPHGMDNTMVKNPGEVNAPAYASFQQGNLMSDWVRRILGPVPGITTLSQDPNYLRKMADQSAVGGVSKYIAMIYTTPPASTYAFIQDVGQTLGFLPKQAYAQGIGFSGLQSLLPVWKAFRNIAYLLLAIVMIVIGFMVMFRKKIDPKTVVTVQNSIPKIVITLLLITFSYAIVGVMIDLMYLTILLAVGIFQTTALLPDPKGIATAFGHSTPQSLYTQGGLWMNIANLFGPDFGSGDTLNLSLTSPTTIAFRTLGWDNTVGRIFSGLGLLVAPLLAVPGINLISLPVAAGIATVAGLPLILGLLLSIAILLLMLRLFIFFFSHYIQIILALIFAPIQLLGEAIPGSSTFSSWFRNLIANMIVFPLGAVMFMLSAVFINIANQNLGPLWTPPFTPLISSNVTAIASLLALGILFALPGIASSIKEALKAKPFVGAGPEGIAGSFSQPVGLGMQLYQMWVSHRSMDAFSKMANLQQKSQGEHG